MSRNNKVNKRFTESINLILTQNEENKHESKHSEDNHDEWDIEKVVEDDMEDDEYDFSTILTFFSINSWYFSPYFGFA